MIWPQYKISELAHNSAPGLSSHCSSAEERLGEICTTLSVDAPAMGHLVRLNSK